MTKKRVLLGTRRKAAKVSGFRARSQTSKGKAILSARRRKKRKKLSSF